MKANSQEQLDAPNNQKHILGTSSDNNTYSDSQAIPKDIFRSDNSNISFCPSSSPQTRSNNVTQFIKYQETILVDPSKQKVSNHTNSSQSQSNKQQLIQMQQTSKESEDYGEVNFLKPLSSVDLSSFTPIECISRNVSKQDSNGSASSKFLPSKQPQSTNQMKRKEHSVQMALQIKKDSTFSSDSQEGQDSNSSYSELQESATDHNISFEGKDNQIQASKEPVSPPSDEIMSRSIHDLILKQSHTAEQIAFDALSSSFGVKHKADQSNCSFSSQKESLANNKQKDLLVRMKQFTSSLQSDVEIASNELEQIKNLSGVYENKKTNSEIPSKYNQEEKHDTSLNEEKQKQLAELEKERQKIQLLIQDKQRRLIEHSFEGSSSKQVVYEDSQAIDTQNEEKEYGTVRKQKKDISVERIQTNKQAKKGDRSINTHFEQFTPVSSRPAKKTHGSEFSLTVPASSPRYSQQSSASCLNCCEQVIRSQELMNLISNLREENIALKTQLQERQQAAQSLQASEERVAALLRNVEELDWSLMIKEQLSLPSMEDVFNWVKQVQSNTTQEKKFIDCVLDMMRNFSLESTQQSLHSQKGNTQRPDLKVAWKQLKQIMQDHARLRMRLSQVNDGNEGNAQMFKSAVQQNLSQQLGSSLQQSAGKTQVSSSQISLQSDVIVLNEIQQLLKTQNKYESLKIIQDVLTELDMQKKKIQYYEKKRIPSQNAQITQTTNENNHQYFNRQLSSSLLLQEGQPIGNGSRQVVQQMQQVSQKMQRILQQDDLKQQMLTKNQSQNQFNPFSNENHIGSRINNRNNKPSQQNSESNSLRTSKVSSSSMSSSQSVTSIQRDKIETENYRRQQQFANPFLQFGQY